MQLKKIDEQAIVITGASSGIGLATAKQAAARGARVMLCARSEEGLGEAIEQIQREGGRAAYFVADVADAAAMDRLADHARASFGGFDSWVNNAGVSVYGAVEDVALEDMRRLFDVTYWGVVNGSLAALPELRRRGGALINVGSVESDVAIPLTATYAAAKHAVKGFTDALRIELAHGGAPVSVSLVKPASIDTPFFEHAKSYLDGDPKPAPPVYAPEVVARAILGCAEKPVREIVVGGAGKALGATRMVPSLGDGLLRRTMFEGQETEEPRPHRDPHGSLFRPRGSEARERGDYPGHVMRSSLYTHAALHPMRTLALAGASLLALRLLRGGLGRSGP